MGFTAVEVEEYELPDGRWRLLSKWDEGNLVSTVRLSENQVARFADTILSSFGLVTHNQPYETLVMANGKWLSESQIGSRDREAARKVHKRMAEQFVEGKFHKP